MKYTLKMLFGAVLLLSLTAAGSPGFQGLRLIAGYDVGDTSQLIIRFSSDNGCGIIAAVPREKPYYSDMVAMTISAFNSGRPLNVYLSSCPTNGVTPEIVRMVQGVVF